MFLQRLAEYADRLEREGKLPPRMYEEVPVRYVIRLDSAGNFRSPLVTRSAKEGERDRGVPKLMPNRKRAYAIKPKLLADHAEYTFGLARAGSDPRRAADLHRAYVELVRKCADQTQEPTVRAVATFLGSPDSLIDTTTLNLDSDFDRAAVITFQVGDIFPTDLPSVQRFWANEASATDPNAPQMQCLVCGETRPPVVPLPIAVKGVPGNPTGMALVSANAHAFESYGLANVLTSPICEACGLHIGHALNALIKREDTHLRIGDVVYIFWSRELMGFSLVDLLSRAEPEDVREFLKAAWRARPSAAQLDVAPFYAATLSGNNARVVVRDWIETTLGEAQRHLERYFELQKLRGYDGEDRWLSLFTLVRATVRVRKEGKSNRHKSEVAEPISESAEAGKEEPAPQVGQALLHLALHGGELPMWLLYQAVRRTRAEQRVWHEHAALIKMVLQSQGAGQDMSELDMTNREPAYLCGRLLAVLEAVQYAALGETNATIVDRYFGTASSAPASVFGRLVRGAQPHLGKLRHENPGAFVRLDEALREVLSGLETFPYTLSLEKQGLFALGYYHQRAADITIARQKKAAKAGVGVSSGDAGGEDA